MSSLKKVLIMILLFSLAISGVFPVFATDDAQINVGAPVFKKLTDGQETEIHAIENGKIQTEVGVTLTSGTQADVVLALALYDASNKLVDISLDSKTVYSQGAVLKTDIDVSDGLQFKYFVWNGLAALKPLPMAPQKPYSLSAPHISNSEAVLNWSQGIGEVEGYDVYRDGLYLGETPVPRFADSYLDENTTYNYSIAAKNDGLSSENAHIQVTTSSALNVEFVQPYKEYNLSFLAETSDKADAYTIDSEIGGKACRRSVPIPIAAPTRFGLFYFAVQKNLISPNDKNVTFEVTYYDNGTGAIKIEYNAIPATDADPAISNIAKPITIATRTNTNTWKTARVSVIDANFRKAAAVRNCDFRISGGADTYIAKVTVEKSEYFGKGASSAKIGGDYPNLYLMDFKKTTAYEFNVNDSIISASDKNINIDLTYSDTGSNNIVLTYKNTSGQMQTSEIPVSGSGNDVIKRIKLSDAKLDGSINSFADFTLRLKDSSDLPSIIKNVKATKQVYQYGAATLAGDNCTYSGMRLLTEFTGDTINTAANIGGRDCRKIESTSGAIKHFYFRVDDETVFGAKDNNLILKFTYFDEGTQQMTLQYNSQSNAYAALNLGVKTNTQKWITKEVALSNAAFTNAQSTNYLADFRIKVDTGTLYLSDITILPGKTAFIQRNLSPTIFLAGDSTCEPLSATYAPREGWGMEISQFFLSSVTVNNQAKGGKSSKSFLSGADPTAVPAIIDDGRMRAILSGSKPGDYLFIQFGHNDRNSASVERYTSPTSLEENDTSYRYNLKRFVQIASSYGIKPIFLTSIRERKFNGITNVLLDDGIEAYRTAMKEVGAQLGVPVIDVGTAHKSVVETWGNEGSKALYLFFTKDQYPNYPATLPDSTHISQTGATEVCKIIVNGIKAGAGQNETLASLANFIDNSVSTTPLSPTN